MNIKAYVIIVFCSFLFIACNNNNTTLKPPKKSPCACYDIQIDMENIHV